MKLTAKTIQILADYTCGGLNGWPYRKGEELVTLFNNHGFEDEYPFAYPSRAAYARAKLTELAPKPQMEKLLCELVSARNWIGLEQPVLHSPKDCLNQLNELLVFDNYQVVESGHRHKVRQLNRSIITLESIPETLPELSAIFIEEQIEKCRNKIDDEDFDGAITNARSLLEHMLLALEAELSTEAPPTFDGDLVKLFGRVRKLLNLDASRKDISESLKQVLSGLTSIVTGLAAMRNKMSDSHGTCYRPQRHHAKLAVNSAKTLADFLFETKDYQQEMGFLAKK